MNIATLFETLVVFRIVSSVYFVEIYRNFLVEHVRVLLVNVPKRWSHVLTTIRNDCDSIDRLSRFEHPCESTTDARTSRRRNVFCRGFDNVESAPRYVYTQRHRIEENEPNFPFHKLG